MAPRSRNKNFNKKQKTKKTTTRTTTTDDTMTVRQMKNKKRSQRHEFTCPILSKNEYEEICVPFDQIQDPTRGVDAILEEYGYCVIPDILSSEEVKEMECTMKNDLNKLIDEDQIYPKNGGGQPKTPASNFDDRAKRIYQTAKEEGIAKWPQTSLNHVYLKEPFISMRGMAHSTFAWKCRLNPRVRRVFEVLHGTDELVTGFDNSVGTNDQVAEEKYNSCWAHIDHNDYDTSVPGGVSNWKMYQGLLSIWSTETSHASTTVVWPKSHKPDIYDAYLNDSRSHELGKAGVHFVQLLRISDEANRDRMFAGWKREARRVTIPAGGLLIWSSRLTHQGWAGGPRLGQFICWEPKSRRDEYIVRGRKLVLAALGLPTTHWASRGQPHNLSRFSLHKGIPNPMAVTGMMNNDDSILLQFPMKKASTVRHYALRKDRVVDIDELWLALKNIDINVKLPEAIRMMLEDVLDPEILEVL